MNYSDNAGPLPYLWLVGNGGMGYNHNYYYYHSPIPYQPKEGYNSLKTQTCKPGKPKPLNPKPLSHTLNLHPYTTI